MSIKRIIVALPVVAGLVLAGTAAARMLPAETVRSDAYPSSGAHPRCAHNGVHLNKQNHPNCGLHLGWSQEESGGSRGDDDAAPGEDRSHGHGRQEQKHGGREQHGHHGDKPHGNRHERSDRKSHSHGHGGGRPSDEVHGGPKHGK